jgi:hypothetical protein
MIRSIVVALFYAYCSFANPPEVLWQIKGITGIETVVLLRPSDFTTHNIMALCRSFLQENRNFTIMRYVMATDEVDARTGLVGRGITDKSFAEWRRAYIAHSKKVPATAEMIRLGNDVAVRIRSAHGEIVERVLVGSSPFAMDFKHQLVRILYVSLTPSTCPEQGGVTAHLFVQTPEPWNSLLATEFTRILTARLHTHCFILSIEDGWHFPEYEDYPVYNRFVPRFRPPTIEQHRSRRRFYCEAERLACR